MPFIFRKEFSFKIKCSKDDKKINDSDRIKPMYTELDPELNRQYEEKLSEDSNHIDPRDYHYNN